MKKSSCCECCGGSLKRLGNRYIKCEYCGQVYSVAKNDDVSTIDVEDVYQDALKLCKTGVEENIKEAANLFKELGAYKDSDEQAAICLGRVREIAIEEEEKRLSQLREEELEKINSRKQAQKNKRIAFYFMTILMGIVACILIAFVINASYKKVREEKYVTALSAYEEENYEEALKIFEELGDYCEATIYVSDIRKIMEESKKVYDEAYAWYEAKEYEKALEGFTSIVFYGDSETYIEQISNAIIQDARAFFEAEDYNSAKVLIALIPKDREQYYKGIALGKEIEEVEKAAEEARKAAILLENYNKAIELYNSNDYISAQGMFLELNGYEQTAEYLEKIGNALYDYAKALYDAGDYLACAETLKSIDDSSEWVNCQLALELWEKAKGKYADGVTTEAISLYRNENYNSMVTYLETKVCELYPRERASELKNEYEPVNLATVERFSVSMEPYWNTGDCQDTFGTDYSSVKNYLILKSTNAFLEYYVDGEYVSLSGTVSPHSKLINDGWGTLKIYADDKLVYSQKITRKTEPIEFTVSIEGAKYIGMEVEGDCYGWVDSVLLLTNLFLNK